MNHEISRKEKKKREKTQRDSKRDRWGEFEKKKEEFCIQNLQREEVAVPDSTLSFWKRRKKSWTPSHKTESLIHHRSTLN